MLNKCLPLILNLYTLRSLSSAVACSLTPGKSNTSVIDGRSLKMEPEMLWLIKASQLIAGLYNLESLTAKFSLKTNSHFIENLQKPSCV